MAVDRTAYVVSLQNNLRSRPIPWEGAVRAKTISEDANQKIKAIDKVRKDQKTQVVNSDKQTYVSLFLGSKNEPNIFQAVSKRQDILPYLLVLFDDVITDNLDFVTALLKHPDPYAPFIPLVKSGSNMDESTPLLAHLVLTQLLSQAIVSSKSTTAQDTATTTLYSYLSTLSESSDPSHQEIAVKSYGSILRSPRTRQLFWENRKDTLDPLIDIVKSGSGTTKDTSSTLLSDNASTVRPETGIAGGVGIQLMYYVLLVLWKLSFSGDLVGEGLQDEYDIVVLYVQLLRISPKEKITRVALATLKNLIETNREVLLPSAVLVRLPVILGNLKSKHLTDEDLLDDLNWLTDTLEEYTATQTTFDEYAAELRTGHLRWSPVHKSDTFWSENARRIIEENHGELIQLLAEIMTKSWETDKQVLAIGCSDVASLIRVVPEKRPALVKVGLKTRVMELMQDPNETVKWESLRAVGEWFRYSSET